VQTLTGFKWIVRAGVGLPGSRFLFGYEEALGFAVGSVVRDKDGISAALTFLSLTAAAVARGQSVLDLLDALEQRHGVHLTSQLSLRSESPSAALARLRGRPPTSIAGRPITEVVDLWTSPAGSTGLPRADLLIYRLDGARIAVRPSGTEPKLKVYFEVVRPVTTDGLVGSRRMAAVEMGVLRQGSAALLA
jgi:phosphomannomutase